MICRYKLSELSIVTINQLFLMINYNANRTQLFRSLNQIYN